ncbi:hypothetical protein CDAR_548021 [Caerostris darwini]|uniref:Uncharacterized protein n=1 Tax=Caerostris darwini TaxID=1538125 RepID=A0AAV4WEU2_9ARAC|nr:hypothetical protein CDAR_548021 [Caerostris darwini]
MANPTEQFYKSPAYSAAEKTIKAQSNNLLYSDISVNHPYPFSSKQQKPNLLLQNRQLTIETNLSNQIVVLPTDKTINGSEQNNLLYSDISVNPPHPLSSKQQKPNLLLHKRQHTMEANLSNCPTKRKNGPALSRKSHLAGRWP